MSDGSADLDHALEKGVQLRPHEPHRAASDTG